MTEVYALNLGQKTEEALFRDLLALVSEERNKRIKRFRFRQDAERSLFAEAIIQYIVAVKFHVSYPQYRFIHNQYGKPYIKGHPEWQFNVSHSGCWVVCGFGAEEIGIDIEQITPVETQLLETAFSPGERAYLESLGRERGQEGFYDLWTLKESYIKYRGRGLSLPLDEFDIRMDGQAAALNLPEADRPCFYRWEIGPGYRLAVCTMERNKPQLNFLSSRQIWGKLCSTENTGG